MGLSLKTFKYDTSNVSSTAMVGFSCERNLFPFLEEAALDGGTPATFTIVPKKAVSEFKAEKWQFLTREMFAEKTIKQFNDSKFGRAGYDGAKIIQQLTGKSAGAEHAAPKPDRGTADVGHITEEARGRAELEKLGMKF